MSATYNALKKYISMLQYSMLMYMYLMDVNFKLFPIRTIYLILFFDNICQYWHNIQFSNRKKTPEGPSILQLHINLKVKICRIFEVIFWLYLLVGTSGRIAGSFTHIFDEIFHIVIHVGMPWNVYTLLPTCHRLHTKKLRSPTPFVWPWQLQTLWRLRFTLLSEWGRSTSKS